MKIKIYNTLIARVQSESEDYETNPMEFADTLFDVLEHDDTNLAEYADEYHGDSYYKKLNSIILSVEILGGELYGVATCEVDDDWNESDTEQLKEYLTAQYADGWGEGFEQRPISYWREEVEYEEYDEENDEYYTDYVNERFEAYISFWQSRNFKIFTIE